MGAICQIINTSPQSARALWGEVPIIRSNRFLNDYQTTDDCSQDFLGLREQTTPETFLDSKSHFKVSYYLRRTDASIPISKCMELMFFIFRSVTAK